MFVCLEFYSYRQAVISRALHAGWFLLAIGGGGGESRVQPQIPRLNFSGGGGGGGGRGGGGMASRVRPRKFNSKSRVSKIEVGCPFAHGGGMQDLFHACECPYMKE